MEEKKKSKIRKSIKYLFAGLCIVALLAVNVTYASSYKAKNAKSKKTATVEKTKKPYKISTVEECKEKGLHRISDMHSAYRGFSSATVLADERVLILGYTGTYHAGYEKLSEIFDSKTNSFTVAPNPNFSHNSAILLKDGNVLLTGKELEVYNPKTNTFTTIEKASSYYNGSPVFTSFISDDELFQIGLEGKFEIFNLKTGEFNEGEIENKAFNNGFTYGVNLGNGKILLTFFTASGNPRHGIAVYDIKTNEIIKEEYLPIEWPKPTKLADGNILLSNWRYVEKSRHFLLYDTKKYEVAKELDMLYEMDKERPQQPRAISLSTGDVLFLEGNTIRQKYDSKLGEFVAVPKVKLDSNRNQGIIPLNDHQILIVGGTVTQPKDHNDYTISVGGPGTPLVKSAWIYTY